MNKYFNINRKYLILIYISFYRSDSWDAYEHNKFRSEF